MVSIQNPKTSRRKLVRSHLLVLLSVLLFTVSAATGCADGKGLPNNVPGSTDETYRRTIFDTFDTVTTVMSRGLTEEEFNQVYDKIDSEIHRYDKLFTRFTLYPNIANVALMNDRAAAAAVTVEPEVYALMKESERLAGLTCGKYRPDMGSVIDLWHQAFIAAGEDAAQTYVPEIEELEAAALHSGADKCNVTPAGGTAEVAYSDPEFLWDYGAIAKGYTVEKIAAELAANGTDGVLLSAGGNVRTVGRAPEGGWRIGIQDPLDNSGILGVIPVTEGAVVTSGINQRFFIYEGKRYHHIIDPETLMPAERYAAVTIIGPDSGVADVLSTAIFNADKGETEIIMTHFPDYQWLKVYPDGKIERSDGFPEFLED